MYEDRRKFKRIPKKILIRYKELVMSEDAKKVFLSELINISACGILFESEHSFPIDTALKMELKIDRWQKFSKSFYRAGQTSISEPFVAVGKITRIAALQNGKYVIGVDLTNVDETHREALKRYLDHLVEEKWDPYAIR